MKTYEVMDLLQKMALEGRRYFSPHYICERLGIDDAKEVASFLLSATCKDIVIPRFEVECPEGDSDFSTTDISLISNDPRTCRYCGTEYIPDPKHIWLTFNFTDQYKQDIKKKNYLVMQMIPVLEKSEEMIHAV